MQHSYYIYAGGQKDGPYDLVAIMRRIRAQKIGPDTGIFVDEAEEPVPANQVPEITSFFTQGLPEPAVSFQRIERAPSFKAALVEGWRFVIEHNIMTVFAGGLLLMSMMLGGALINSLGWVRGGIAGWLIFAVFHNLYMVFVLRLYRGQTLSADFLDRQLPAILPTLVLSSLVLAAMMAGGLFLLLIPCALVAILYAFVPFFILDHRFGVVEAMEASRLLISKHKKRYFSSVCLLVLMHGIGIALIAPIPLTLPLFIAGLAEIYERLVAI